MTRFLDGPAAGQLLSLRSSPELLRVCSKDGKWDALDQRRDMPAAGEVLYVYVLAEKKGSVHLRPGGFFPIADYRLYPTQPSLDVMRSPMDWAEWCRAEYEKMNERMNTEVGK
jgi:hypothetical protein